MADKNKNGSQHSHCETLALDPVFSDAQMQMLRGMIAQAKEVGRAEGRAEAATPRRAADLPRRPDAADLPRRLEGLDDTDRRDLPRRRRYDPENDDDPDDPCRRTRLRHLGRAPKTPR